MSRMRGAWLRAGFTLVDVLVSLAIVCLLISIMLPVLSHGRAMGWNTKCQSNLRQFAIAVNAYVQDYKVLPGYVAPAFVELNLPADSSVCPANKLPDFFSYLYPAGPMVVESNGRDRHNSPRWMTRMYEDDSTLPLIQDAKDFHLGRINMATYDGCVKTRLLRDH